MLPKIYIYCVHNAGLHDTDVVGYALAEDGSALKQHMSSSLDLLRRDMGIGAPFFEPDAYKDHYPHGYELIDLTHLDETALRANHELRVALERNKDIDDPT